MELLDTSCRSKLVTGQPVNRIVRFLLGVLGAEKSIKYYMFTCWARRLPLAIGRMASWCSQLKRQKRRGERADVDKVRERRAPLQEVTKKMGGNRHFAVV